MKQIYFQNFTFFLHFKKYEIQESTQSCKIEISILKNAGSDKNHFDCTGPFVSIKM